MLTSFLLSKIHTNMKSTYQMIRQFVSSGMVISALKPKLTTVDTNSHWQVSGAIKMLRLSEDTPLTSELHPLGQTRVLPAAELVGVSRQTLRRWYRAGKFPKPKQINGMLLFQNCDLIEWLDNSASDTEETQGG